MTDRNTISQVIESLFEDWIERNKNIHPLAVENMMLLKTDALALLKGQEAVEPVKLVRCKNCKHCDSERIDKNMIWCKIHQFGRPDDYYCADGIEK